MICPNCGTQNIDGSKPCIKCGGNVSSLQSNQNSFDGGNNPSNQKSKLILVIFSLGVILIAIGVFLHLKKDKTISSDTDINYTASFFIQDSKGKYALFNDDGKKLTDFIYTSVDDFVNGTAIVMQDKKIGIISTDGKMAVEFDKYKHITSKAGMYEVTGKDYHTYLINGKGKVLYDMKNAELITYVGEDTYSILKNEKEKVYNVLNYSGKSIISFPMMDDVEEPKTSEEKDGCISVFYNGKTFVIDVNKGKKIMSFKSDQAFCLHDVQNNEKTFTLVTCSSWYEKNDKSTLKIIDNGKVIDIGEECDSISFFNENMICNKNYAEYFLDNNYKRSDEYISTDYAYSSKKNYVKVNDKSPSSIDFYNNGSVVKNVACRILGDYGYMNENIYVLKTYPNSECGTKSYDYEFYDANGKKLFDKSFADAKCFDKNGYAEVSDDKENYYLINKKGRQISNLYDEISSMDSDNYYIVVKDDKMGVIGKNGKQILPCEYSYIDISKIQNKEYAILETSDSKKIIYNLDDNKTVITSDKGKISVYDHYISVATNNKRQYYSYTTGKMFYEN